MAEVKVMWARADGPGAVKGECWVLTDRSEQPGDCSILKIQILKFSQTCYKFKMNFNFHFKMFVCKLISTNKI
jgi:hypothetical protein